MKPVPRPNHHPWLVGLLGFIIPGLGHGYNRQWANAILFAIACVGLWCAGFGWLVHLAAAGDGWLAARRIREWGWLGCSVRTSARCGVETEVAKRTVTLVEPSLAMQARVESLERTEHLLRNMARYSEQHTNSAMDVDGVFGFLLLFFAFFEPIQYAILRRRQIRESEALKHS